MYPLKTLQFIGLMATFSIISCKDDPSSIDPPASDRDRVIQEYETVFLANDVTTVPWNGSTSSCNSGTMDPDVQQKTLNRINYFRELAGLPGNITFKPEWDAKCMDAALMCHSNGSLNHNPPDSWKCFTTGGKEAATKSNLSASPATKAIVSYMRDAGGGNIDVGHRRWILYSRAKTMGHGSTDRYDALWVFGGGSSSSSVPEYIAWPPKMVPAPLVWPRWSFSVPGGNFSNATVTLRSNGTEISANVISRAANYGDPTIVFEPQSIDLSGPSDIEFDLEVKNVMVAGTSKDFKHKVTVVQVN